MPRNGKHIFEITYERLNKEAFTCRVNARTIVEAISVFNSTPNPDEIGEIIKIERWK